MKVKTKKIFLRLFNLIMICLILSNIVTALWGVGGISKATDVWKDITSNADAKNIPVLMLEALLGTGLPYIFGLILKLIIVAIGMVLQLIMSGIYNGFEGNGAGDFKIVTTEDIIFSGTDGASKFLSVDFLDGQTGGTIAGTFRTSVAQWYMSLRAVAAAGLLIILIYVGVKMALSTVGKDQARYKEMFMDWAGSVALLFLLHWIIAFVMFVNNALIKGLNVPGNSTVQMINQLTKALFDAGFHSYLAAVIYTVLVGQIFKFFILYIKRMITVGFLIMISPLITITYSLDKMGDKKAQALNAWLKELSYNVLIQPFHAIIFVSFYSSITDMVIANDSIAPYVFSIVLLGFMTKAEQIVRNIFHFEARHGGSMQEAAQTLGAATGTFTKLGNSASKVLPKFRQAGGLKALSPIKASDIKNSKFAKKMKNTFSKISKTSSENQNAGTTNTGGSNGGSPNGGGTKKTTAQKVKDRIERHKQNKEEKAIENRARKNYDSLYGKGTYDYRKQQAANGSKNSETIVKETRDFAKAEIEREELDKKANKEIKKNPKKYKGMKRSQAKKLARRNVKEAEHRKEVAKKDKEVQQQAKETYAPKSKLDEQVKKKVEQKIKSGDTNYKHVKSYEGLMQQAEKGTPAGQKMAKKLINDAKKEVLDENVKKSIDKQYGKGSYENLKNNQTLDSGFWDRARDEEENKLKNEPAKRNIFGPKSNTDNPNQNNSNQNGSSQSNDSNNKKKEITGVRKWFSEGFKDMRFKEQWGAATALFEDSTKIAAAIALGGFAFGATDKLTTAISVGQFGYGFADGMWENSSKTVTKDLQEMLQKYAAFNGGKLNLDDLANILDTFKQNGARGVYDKLEEMQRSLSNDFKTYINDATKRSAIFFDIDEAIAKDGKNVDINEIFNKHFANNQKAQENADSIKSELSNYANKMMEASIFKSLEKVEATGMSIGTAARIVQEPVKKAQRDVQIDVNINQEDNRTTVYTRARGQGVDNLNSQFSAQNGGPRTTPTPTPGPTPNSNP